MEVDGPLADALREEYGQMAVRLERARDRAQRLRVLADQAADQVVADERLLRSMAEVLGISPQSTIDDVSPGLRGQRLREVAVEVLRDHLEPGDDIHYRDWFSLVADSGVRVAGRDPLATFLAQVSRAADIEPVGRRTGRYRLRAIA
jgi:hypothetical protein